MADGVVGDFPHAEIMTLLQGPHTSELKKILIEIIEQRADRSVNLSEYIELTELLTGLIFTE